MIEIVLRVSNDTNIDEMISFLESLKAVFHVPSSNTSSDRILCAPTSHGNPAPVPESLGTGSSCLSPVPGDRSEGIETASATIFSSPYDIGAPTKEDVRTALTAAMHEHGAPFVTSLLCQYNASAVRDLSPDHYAAVIAACGVST